MQFFTKNLLINIYKIFYVSKEEWIKYMLSILKQVIFCIFLQVSAAPFTFVQKSLVWKSVSKPIEIHLLWCIHLNSVSILIKSCRAWHLAATDTGSDQSPLR